MLNKLAYPERLFLAFAWGPWVALATIFRVIFMGSQSDTSVWFYVDSLRLLIGVYGVVALLGWMAFRGLSHVLSRRAMTGALLATQGGFLFLSFMEMAAFNFWKVTGTQLDYSLIHYTVQDIQGVFHLVSESTPWYLFVVFVVVAALMIGGPLMIYRRAAAVSSKAGVPVKAWVALCVTMLVPCWPLLSKSYTFAAVSPSPLYLVKTYYDYAERGMVVSDAPVLRPLLEPHQLKAVGKPKNVVVIILESTRAFSVQPYQQKHKTTPFLNALSKKSVWAKNAYAVVPHTSKALVAILCGVEPHLEMPIREANRDGLPAQCLAKLLRKNGYETAYFQSATQRFEQRKGLVRNMGYKDFYPSERLKTKGFERANYFGKEDAIMLKPSMTWVDDHKKKPFLLTYLTLTPHHQYLAPRKRYGFESFVKEDEMNRYLNTVHYVDQFSKDVVEGLKKRGLYKNTIFVFVGDHGEGFNEHDRSQHDNVIYEEGLRVPLIIHDPSSPKEQMVPYSVNQLDIIPTVLSMAGWRIDPTQWRGQDIRTLKDNRMLFAHCWYNRRCMAAIDGANKYIHHFKREPDEFFDLARDPLEKKAASTSKGAMYMKAMKTWRQSVLQTYQSYFSDTVKSYINPTPPKNVTTPTEISYKDWVTMIGYDLSPAKGPYKSGQKVTLTSYFKVNKKIPAGWKFFIHGTASNGRMIKNLDHRALNGMYPEQEWEPGQYITDKHSFAIPAKSRKVLDLRVGMWHKKEGRLVPESTTHKLDKKKRLILLRLPLK